MDLLEKLKMVRDEINLLIENEEKKKAQQSEVGKKFRQRIDELNQKKMNETVDDVWRNGREGIKIEKIF